MENPRALLALIAIFPAVLFVLRRFKKIEGLISSPQNQKILTSLRISVFLRTFFRSLAWICAALALSEISFGTKNVPAQKSGNNVTFVFDISYSMMAKDAPSGLTRLDAAKIYANSLIEKLSGASFSAVLAKGDGFTAVPETEDALSVLSLIENLSPLLVSSAGSSLGKGIETAVNAVPQNSPKSQHIWVFTDGDETDNRLEKSLELAAKAGIPVSIIGFGSETESEITAGDGKTKVKTALRAKKMKEIADAANEKSYSLFFAKKSPVLFIDSKSQGSAWQLLRQIKQNSPENEENALSYEVKKINRHAFFIFFAVIFLLLSFVAEEFHLSSLKNKKFLSFLKKSALLSLVFFLPSCKSEKKLILEGTWAWYEGKYTTATADFLNAANGAEKDSIEKSYAIFDLSATYFSVGELDASFKRLSELNLDDENLPVPLRTKAFYNMGLICAQKNDYSQAEEFFKKAVLVDSKNLSAKINLELCRKELVQEQSRSGETEMKGAGEEKQVNPEMKNEIFNLIRENEGKKWRNMSESGEKNNDALDY